MADDLRIQEAQLRSMLGPASPLGDVGGEYPSRPQPAATGGPSFAETLTQSIQEVNRLQQEATAAANDLVSGEHRDVHGAIIAMQKADVSFKLMMEIRNKIVDAYKEVMRMQV